METHMLKNMICDKAQKPKTTFGMQYVNWILQNMNKSHKSNLLNDF